MHPDTTQPPAGRSKPHGLAFELAVEVEEFLRDWGPERFGAFSITPEKRAEATEECRVALVSLVMGALVHGAVARTASHAHPQQPEYVHTSRELLLERARDIALAALELERDASQRRKQALDDAICFLEEVTANRVWSVERAGKLVYELRLARDAAEKILREDSEEKP